MEPIGRRRVNKIGGVVSACRHRIANNIGHVISLQHVASR